MSYRIAALLIFAFAVTACSRLDASNALPSTSPALTDSALRPAIRNFKTIFTFGNDGWGPSNALIALNGYLYGTTANGGTYNHGTAFRLSKSGAHAVIHEFGSDGVNPIGPLIAVDNVLYGVTFKGGSHNAGTAYAMRPDGTKVWTYDFKSRTNGLEPSGGLTNLRGVLYGTTIGGGNSSDSGTFFKVTRSGQETTLHAFDGGFNDGSWPNEDLTVIDGEFYLTTLYGGYLGGLPGTALRLSPSGRDTLLFRFSTRNGGHFPKAGLVYLDGAFYGTTNIGGKYGCGTVFMMDRHGNVHTVHNFGQGHDGRFPQGRLMAYEGNLYGTTPGGGIFGAGSVFELSPKGREQVLYDFHGDADGSEPTAGLVALDGVLYGTTMRGPDAEGYGTVFDLTP